MRVIVIFGYQNCQQDNVYSVAVKAFDKQSKKGKCTIYGCFFFFLKPPNEKDNMKS